MFSKVKKEVYFAVVVRQEYPDKINEVGMFQFTKELEKEKDGETSEQFWLCMQLGLNYRMQNLSNKKSTEKT